MRSAGRAFRVENLHNGPANIADEDHKGPARDHAETVDTISQNNVKVVLGKPTVSRVQSALVSGNILVGLLGMDLVDVLGGNSGLIQMNDMERSRRALSSLLGLRDLEVPNAGCACNPSGAKNLVGLAVQVTKIRRGRVDREQQNGFLSIHKSATIISKLANPYLSRSLTLNALLGRSQRPKHVLFPPVTKRSNSCGFAAGAKAACQLVKLNGVTAFCWIFCSTTFSTAGITGVAVGR